MSSNLPHHLDLTLAMTARTVEARSKEEPNVLGLCDMRCSMRYIHVTHGSVRRNVHAPMANSMVACHSTPRFYQTVEIEEAETVEG